jgi:site-specific recombinase XerD
MASFYPIKSKYYWAKWRDPASGEIKRNSLKILKTARGLVAARKEIGRLTELENQRFTNRSEQRFGAWVHEHLDRSCEHELTLHRYLVQWRHIADYLETVEIEYPSQVTYALVPAYLKWRTSHRRRKGKLISQNTAKAELKCFSRIMKEAARRGYCTANPFAQLGVKSVTPALKPEMTDEDIRIIREELQKEPEWMQTCFEICLLTGCRRHESSINFNDIDLEKRLIRFVDPKGGPKRAFTIKFTRALVPLLQRLKDKGYEKTLELPEKKREWKFTGTNHFSRFFKAIRHRLSNPGICLHCTRVTFISRHARAGTPQRVVMQLVNHANTAVHQIYSRFSFEDVPDSALEIGLPPPPLEQTLQYGV